MPDCGRAFCCRSRAAIFPTNKAAELGSITAPVTPRPLFQPVARGIIIMQCIIQNPGNVHIRVESIETHALVYVIMNVKHMYSVLYFCSCSF